jgi:HPt (histidine-containing phosphotransfer) domain-containing protein
MTDNNPAVIVTVAKDLADLIPVFFKNRQKELETLRSALTAGDYDQLRQLGHRMKGVGDSYGFAKVSEIGKRVEDGARSADQPAIDACIGEYADYLARVQVVYE